MRIVVRIVQQGAADLAKTKAGLAALEKQTARAAGVTGMFGREIRQSNLERYGKNLQWTGRQIEYNFTLPILAAGYAATKFANQNEAAFVKLQKVYGDNNSEMQATYQKELPQLRKAFEALSNIYGVHQEEVIGIGAAWASAGASGIALAKATRLTMDTMILGEFEAVAATEALIAIQSQYGLSTKELAQTIGVLNMVENQTAVSFNGLVQAFQRAAGSARTAGVDVRHLAAMVASITPAAGSAAQAGNSLKTIFSRMLAPTGDAADILRAVGINLDSVAWQSKNADERLNELAVRFNDLDDAQKAVVSSTVATRYQISRFDVLMRDLINPLGNYQRALKATEDPTTVMIQYQKELGNVLASSPQAFKILTTQLQNMLAKIIVPMIPAILALMSHVVGLVRAFTELSPVTQQWVLIGLAALAVVGPLVRYTGAFALLLSKLGGALVLVADAFKLVVSGLGFFLSGMMTLLRFPFTVISAGFGMITRALVIFATRGIPALLGPWGIALAAAVTIFFMFRDQIMGAIDAIGKRFAWLPEIIVQVMRSIISILRSAASAIAEWLSYLNPFARHSPSLVEQVTAGVDLIANKYASLANIGTHFRRAIADLNAFKSATASVMNSLKSSERAEIRTNIAAVDPSALGSFDALVRSISVLEADLKAVAREFARQEAIVSRWKSALDRASASLEIASNELDRLENIAKAARDALDDAQQALDDWANTPIEGMKAFEDAIFENEMAQKRLRLELLRMEEAGVTIDDLRDKMGKLQGEIEGLRATREDLRLAGADAAQLAVYDAEIAALEAQQGAIEDQADAVNDLMKQLEELERQGEILDLEQSLAFDPLKKQIDDVVNSMQEMPFEEILAGIQAEQANVAQLTAEWEAAQAAVEQQEEVVKSLTAARDLLQSKYDLEKAKLDALGATYDAIEQQIRDMEAAMNDLATAAAKAAEEASMSPAMEAFNAGAGGNWEDVGGTGAGALGREAGDLAALADEWANEASSMFGSFDIFQPVRDKWNQLWAWIDTNIGPHISAARDAIGDMFSGVGGDSVGSFIDRTKEVLADFGSWLESSPISNAVDGIRDAFTSFVNVLERIWNFIKDEVLRLLKTLMSGLQRFGDMLAKEFENWGPLLDPFLEAVKHIVNVVGQVFKVLLSIIAGIVAAIVTVWKALWPVLIHVLRPVLDMIVGVVRAALEIIRGIISVVLGIINGDWSLAWQGILAIVDGVWDAIYAVIKGAIGIIVGIVRGLVESIVDFFTWLWDVLVGHSIIPDMINAIIKWFNFLIAPIKAVWDAIWKAISYAWNTLIKPIFAAVWGFIINTLLPAFNTLKNGVVGAWNLISSGISTAWGAIKGTFNTIIGFVRDNLGKAFTTVKDTILNAFRNVRDNIGDIISSISSKIKSGINIGIRAVNRITSGVNKITDLIGIGVSIAPIQELAAGGTIDPAKTGPFITNGIRAIVGEGNPSYPEFVIPTDPKFRGRAEALYAMLGQQMGIPGYAEGGVIGTAGDLIGNAAGLIKDFWGIIDGARKAINDVPIKFVRDIPKWLIEEVVDWAKDQISKIPGVGLAGDIIGGAVGGAKDAWEKLPFTYKGGIVRGTRHGTALVAGERNRDEAIVPLPNGIEDMGKKEYNFYDSTFEFPNITDPADAEEFLKNLETLVPS